MFQGKQEIITKSTKVNQGTNIASRTSDRHWFQNTAHDEQVSKLITK